MCYSLLRLQLIVSRTIKMCNFKLVDHCPTSPFSPRPPGLCTSPPRAICHPSVGLFESHHLLHKALQVHFSRPFHTQTPLCAQLSMCRSPCHVSPHLYSCTLQCHLRPEIGPDLGRPMDNSVLI